MTTAKVNSILEAADAYQRIVCSHTHGCLVLALQGAPAMGPGDDGISLLSSSNSTSKNTT